MQLYTLYRFSLWFVNLIIRLISTFTSCEGLVPSLTTFWEEILHLNVQREAVFSSRVYKSISVTPTSRNVSQLVRNRGFLRLRVPDFWWSVEGIAPICVFLKRKIKLPGFVSKNLVQLSQEPIWTTRTDRFPWFRLQGRESLFQQLVMCQLYSNQITSYIKFVLLPIIIKNFPDWEEQESVECWVSFEEARSQRSHHWLLGGLCSYLCVLSVWPYELFCS